MGLGELSKIYLEEELAFLEYLLWKGFCQLFDSESNVLRFLLVKARYLQSLLWRLKFW
jgi:hypothetical protein